ncbi:hypothetical protein PoB_006866600 [Plakobranchus ocellatus]|uniref:Uncharacterized protein n=1 Tax=Plakobranchus ocellatus TaxID=259542 RepID=A0AAV4DDD8_9GAST|nr:hypothetical protein PoB_006866600 [Plakobranchus ocellatus]
MGVIELLYAGKGAIELLCAGKGAIELLYAGKGAIELLYAGKGAIELLYAGKGAIELFADVAYETGASLGAAWSRGENILYLAERYQRPQSVVCFLYIASPQQGVSGFQALRQARRQWRGSNPRQKGPSRS